MFSKLRKKAKGGKHSYTLPPSGKPGKKTASMHNDDTSKSTASSGIVVNESGTLGNPDKSGAQNNSSRVTFSSFLEEGTSSKSGKKSSSKKQKSKSGLDVEGSGKKEKGKPRTTSMVLFGNHDLALTKANTTPPMKKKKFFGSGTLLVTPNNKRKAPLPPDRSSSLHNESMEPGNSSISTLTTGNIHVSMMSTSSDNSGVSPDWEFNSVNMNKGAHSKCNNIQINKHPSQSVTEVSNRDGIHTVNDSSSENTGYCSPELHTQPANTGVNNNDEECESQKSGWPTAQPNNGMAILPILTDEQAIDGLALTPKTKDTSGSISSSEEGRHYASKPMLPLTIKANYTSGSLCSSEEGGHYASKPMLPLTIKADYTSGSICSSENGGHYASKPMQPLTLKADNASGSNSSSEEGRLDYRQYTLKSMPPLISKTEDTSYRASGRTHGRQDTLSLRSPAMTQTQDTSTSVSSPRDDRQHIRRPVPPPRRNKTRSTSLVMKQLNFDAIDENVQSYKDYGDNMDHCNGNMKMFADELDLKETSLERTLSLSLNKLSDEHITKLLEEQSLLKVFSLPDITKDLPLVSESRSIKSCMPSSSTPYPTKERIPSVINSSLPGHEVGNESVLVEDDYTPVDSNGCGTPNISAMTFLHQESFLEGELEEPIDSDDDGEEGHEEEEQKEEQHEEEEDNDAMYQWEKKSVETWEGDDVIEWCQAKGLDDVAEVIFGRN